jgi:hypothetical protein
MKNNIEEITIKLKDVKLKIKVKNYSLKILS